jgi:hypothetical protein
LAPHRNPRGSCRGPSSPALGSLHRRLVPIQCSFSSPSSPRSHRHARGSSCGTASHSGSSPQSMVRGVICYLAPCRCSSSSPRLNSPPLTLMRNVESIVCHAYPVGKKKGRRSVAEIDEYSFCKMDSYCRRKLANPHLLCWLIRGPETITFFILGCWR